MPLITRRDRRLTQPLKEVDGAVPAVAGSLDRVAELPAYVIDGSL